MNTVNNITYPQIQAIEPTDNMKTQQQKHDNYQAGGLVLIVLGIGIGAFGAVNHLSGFTVAAFIFIGLGAFLTAKSNQFMMDTEKTKNIHMSGHAEAMAGIHTANSVPYGHMYNH